MIHPVPLPRSKTPPNRRLLAMAAPSMLPCPINNKGFSVQNYIGATAGLKHLLPTLRE
jgi:hypothetical protein